MKAVGYPIKKNVQKLNSGSITVEAALVLPVFVLAMYMFIFLLQVLYVQVEIQAGLQRTARYCEKTGFLYDYVINYDRSRNQECPQNTGASKKKEEESSNQTKSKLLLSASNIVGHIITSELIKSEFLNSVDRDMINHSCIVNGSRGIRFYLSSYQKDTFIADVVALYRVHLPLGFIKFQDFRCKQRCRVRVFVGNREIAEEKDQENDNDEDYVYVTKTGTVYHENPNCTYLKPDIRSIYGRDIASARNKQGAKYYPCESCDPKLKKDQVYFITRQGNRYHTSPSCSKLKRQVIKIKRSEVGSRKPCKKCAE